jgi:hypothetical protein
MEGAEVAQIEISKIEKCLVPLRFFQSSESVHTCIPNSVTNRFSELEF